MAYSTTATEVELAKISKGASGDKIIIKKITSTSKASDVYVDIRTYYTDDSGVLNPTKKGVRFNSEVALDMIHGILMALPIDEIEQLRDDLNGILNEEDEDEENQTEE